MALESQVEPALLEFVWETVRLREFAHRPSRLDSLFLWADEGQARAWHYRQHVLPRRRSPRAPDATSASSAAIAGLYEVEVLTCRRLFVADMNLISYFGDTVASLLERARRYWREGAAAPTGEVLLEGSVAVRRDLLALPEEALAPAADPQTTARVRAAVRWSGGRGSADRGTGWDLTSVHADWWWLEGELSVTVAVPLVVAGWLALEIEGRAAPVPARRHTPPVLLRAGATSRVKAAFTDLPPLAAGTRYRPVLLCDRAAAHYWQLPRYWEGTLHGEWQTVPCPEVEVPRTQRDG